MHYYLEPVFDGRKSFYKKARVEVAGDGSQHLISYATEVAWIHQNLLGNPIAEVYGIYSATTLRHIKEFLKQNGFRADNQAQIVADYCYTREARA